MRILTVGNMYPPLSLGGYELIWQSSVDQLRGRGHTVEVLTTDHGVANGPAPNEDDGIFRELRWYWRDHGWPRLSLRERLAIERHNAAVMRRRLRELRPDVVAWWSMGGMSLSLIAQVRRAGFPAAAIACDDWLLYGPKVDAWTRIFRGRRRFAAPLAAAVAGIPARFDVADVGPVLFMSEALRARAGEAGAGPVSAEVSHRGVESDLFRPAPRPEWSWRLAYVGRIDPRKGIDLAIEALTRLPTVATLAVVGGGDDAHLEELRGLAAERELADRVTFTRSEHDRLQEVYAAADAILFPVRWDEPWGLVPLEAMAVGTPVIASGRGGSGEYLRDRGNCLIFDVDGGPEALATAVRSLADDPRLRADLREAGFDTARRLGVDSFNEAIEGLLTRVAERA